MNLTMDMNRRMLLQRALLLVGAAAMPTGIEALAAAAKAAPRLLGAAHYTLLTAIADTIVPTTDTPGAVAAGVPQTFDALLRNWASPTRRVELTGALDAIDGLARRTKGKGFAALTPAERLEVLTPHDIAALKVVPRPTPPASIPLNGAATVIDPKQGKAKQGPAQTTASMMSGPPVADPAYGKLKELIVTLFYYSETALTHDLPYVHAPGKWEPSVPVTPQTRPFGGAALM